MDEGSIPSISTIKFPLLREFLIILHIFSLNSFKIIPLKQVIVSATNDLTTDQRVHKICTTLHNNGFNVVLVGRKLEKSMSLDREYKTHRIDLFFNKGVCFYAEYNIRLFFFLLIKNKTLLYANDLDTLLANFLVSKLQSVDLIYDSHELFTEVPELINRPLKQKLWLVLERFILPKLKKTITVSQSIANYYDKLYGTKFKVVRNLPKFENVVLSSKIVDKKEKKIIYQGAINKGRGLELMIQAMKYLNNHKLLIVGDGDILVSIQKMIEDMAMQYKVILLGKKKPEELKELTKEADIGLSLEEDLGLNYRYALPNKLFDYIHAEIPVLVSDLPEMKSIVYKYEVGEILVDRTPQGLANQIDKMTNLPKTFFSSKLQKAKLELQWEKEVKTLQEMFEQN